MSTIVNKIKDITGQTEKEKQLREQYTFLQKMAEAKCEQFKSELDKMFLSPEIEKCQVVGNRAIQYFSSQHVDISTNCSDSIKTAINMFFKGGDDVKSGFKELVEVALDTIISNTSIGEQEDKLFFVYPENFAIIRVDVKCYKYQFSSAGIISDSQNVFCYSMCKSIVDHTKLTIDELLYMVTEMLGETNIEKVEAFIKQLKNVWKMLENSSPQTTLKNYIANDAQ